MELEAMQEDRLMATPDESGIVADASPLPARHTQVREQIRLLVEREGSAISQADVARECGFSSGALSAFLAGKYKGSNQSISAKLAAWLEHRNQRMAAQSELPTTPGFVETPTARRILAACGFAHQLGDIAVVHGGAGVSKTSALRHYAKDMPGVWYVEMTSAHGRICAALERVLYAVGAHGSLTQRSQALHDGIVRRVKDTRGLLIVDEAQHLDVGALEALRAIHDQAGIGLVLAGNDKVYARLTGGSRTSEFAQLFSRIGKRIKLPRPLQDDVHAIAHAWGVKGKAELTVLESLAARPGALRVMSKTLRLAAIYAKGQAITREQLLHADDELSGGEA